MRTYTIEFMETGTPDPVSVTFGAKDHDEAMDSLYAIANVDEILSVSFS